MQICHRSHHLYSTAQQTPIKDFIDAQESTTTSLRIELNAVCAAALADTITATSSAAVIRLWVEGFCSNLDLRRIQNKMTKHNSPNSSSRHKNRGTKHRTMLRKANNTRARSPT